MECENCVDQYANKLARGQLNGHRSEGGGEEEITFEVLETVTRETKLDRVFISSTAPEILKRKAAKEALLNAINKLTCSMIQQLQQILIAPLPYVVAITNSTKSETLNTMADVVQKSINTSLSLHKYFGLESGEAIFRSKQSRVAAGEDTASLLMNGTATYGAVNVCAKFTKVAAGENAIILTNGNVTILFKTTIDGYYLMIVGIMNHENKDTESMMKRIADSSCEGLRKHFGNDIWLIDAIADIPHVKFSQEESDPKSNAPVVGEIIQCNN